jgi:hypothetical protein
MRLAARPRAIRGASSRRKRVIRDRVPAAKHCCEIAGEPTSGIDYAGLNVAHRENGKTWRDASATIRSRWEIMNPPMPTCSEDIVALADVTRSLCAESPAQTEQWCCWFWPRRIIFGSAEIAGNSRVISAMQIDDQRVCEDAASRIPGNLCEFSKG